MQTFDTASFPWLPRFHLFLLLSASTQRWLRSILSSPDHGRIPEFLTFLVLGEVCGKPVPVVFDSIHLQKHQILTSMRAHTKRGHTSAGSLTTGRLQWGRGHFTSGRKGHRVDRNSGHPLQGPRPAVLQRN